MPSSFSATASDSLTASDVVTRTVALARTLSDSVTFADALTEYINLATAALTMGANALTVTVGATVTTDMRSAEMLMAAGAMSVAVTDHNVAADLETAIMSMAARPMNVSVGSVVPGDLFGAPILLTGLSGSTSISLNAATVESGELGATATKSIWLEPPSTPGLFSATVVAPAGVTLAVEYMDGSGVADVEIHDSVSGTATTITLTDFVGGTDSERIRIALVSGTLSVPLTVTWALDATVGGAAGPILQVMSRTLNTVYDNLAVSLLNADADEYVTFVMDGGAVATIRADSTGVISYALLSVPDTLGVGAHTVEAITSGGSDLGTFSILSAVVAPSAPAADIAPTLVSQVGTIRWVWQDKQPGGLGDWVMEISPLSAGRIELDAVSNLNPERLIANSGPWIIWEGLSGGTPWQFSGTLLEQTSVQKLQAFCALKRRFYIIDHHSRAHTVVIDGLDLTPKAVVGKPWAHTYTVSAIVLKVVQL